MAAHWYNYTTIYRDTSQYRSTFIPVSVFLWNDFGDHEFDGVGLVVVKSSANAFCLPKLVAHFESQTVFPFSSFFVWVSIMGLGSSDR